MGSRNRPGDHQEPYAIQNSIANDSSHKLAAIFLLVVYPLARTSLRFRRDGKLQLGYAWQPGSANPTEVICNTSSRAGDPVSADSQEAAASRIRSGSAGHTACATGIHFDLAQGGLAKPHREFRCAAR